MNTLFDIPAQHPNTFCRTCIHAQLTAFAHSNKKFYYCTARKSNRTDIGLLKIKLKNPACALHTENKTENGKKKKV